MSRFDELPFPNPNWSYGDAYLVLDCLRAQRKRLNDRKDNLSLDNKGGQHRAELAGINAKTAELFEIITELNEVLSQIRSKNLGQGS